MSMVGYRHGEGFVEHMDQVRLPQKMMGTEIISETLLTGFFPAAVDHEDLRH
jgi:hypothetical protein